MASSTGARCGSCASGGAIWDRSARWTGQRAQRVSGKAGIDLAPLEYLGQGMTSLDRPSCCLPCAGRFLLSSSYTTEVKLWSEDGALVGVFGMGLWALDKPATWQASRQPLGVRRGPSPFQGLLFHLLPLPAPHPPGTTPMLLCCRRSRSLTWKCRNSGRGQARPTLLASTLSHGAEGLTGSAPRGQRRGGPMPRLEEAPVSPDGHWSGDLPPLGHPSSRRSRAAAVRQVPTRGGSRLGWAWPARERRPGVPLRWA